MMSCMWTYFAPGRHPSLVMPLGEGRDIFEVFFCESCFSSQHEAPFGSCFSRRDEQRNQRSLVLAGDRSPPTEAPTWNRKPRCPIMLKEWPLAKSRLETNE